MKRAKAEKLRRAGYRVVDTKEFLRLSEAESELIELKIALMEKAKERRLKTNLRQEDLARRIGSSQSRIAKLEAGASNVSLDLIIRVLLTLGVTQKELGRTIAEAA